MIKPRDKFTAVDKYSIEWSLTDRTIVFVMKGFWNKEDMATFSDALALVATKAAGAPFDILADLSDLAIQSQAAVVFHGDMIARLAIAGLRHHVVVGASPLLTLQVKRASKATIVPFFANNLEQAEQWLRNIRENDQ